jgi:hypothetical protein
MWPDYFPKQCPPAEARSDTIEVYRLVDHDPPTADDFRPIRIEAPHRPFSADQLCLACGVSVFKTVADAVRTRLRFRPLRSKRIAKGTVMPDDGLVLETGEPTHTTWWLQTITPQSSFAEVLPDV